MFKAFLPLFVILVMLVAASGCRNDGFTTDPNVLLEFSTDTLVFDTVFAQAGSVVGYVKVLNRNNDAVELSEVRLKGLAVTQYKINVDGIAEGPFTNIRVPGNDSIYVFITVTIDPTADNAPFVVHEELEFLFNGNLNTVHLMAWGQNVRYYFGEQICDEEWNSQLPYVIVSRRDVNTGIFYPGVEIQEGCTLTIREGTHVYFDGNSSGMFVRGTLRILGTASDTVIFEGSRLENYFQDLPGQWLGIFVYRGSNGNEMNHFVMNESRFGITIGVLDTNDLTQFDNASRPDITIKSSILKNNFSNAIFGFNANIRAENVLAFGGTDIMISLALGGRYLFDNCTFYNSGDVASSHDKKILLVSNFAADNTIKVVNDIDTVRFTNCIVYGSLEEEIDLSKDPLADFNSIFQNCLLRTLQNTDTAGFTGVIKNLDPAFMSLEDDNFRLQSVSPCIDAGRNNGLTTDLDESPRPFGTTYDIGAYEYH